MINKSLLRQKRKWKIRKSVSGSATKPRFTVFRSNKHIFAQLIDDEAGKTLISANDMKVKKGTKVDASKTVGEEIAKLAKAKKIEKAVFDRNGYRFHGRVKAVAEAAREGGLVF